MLTRVIRLTLGAGFLTATVAIVDLTLFLVFRQNNYHTTPALVLAKLYSNSLLVQFNSRIRIRGARDEELDYAMNSFHSSAVQVDLMSRNGGGGASGSAPTWGWRRRSHSYAGARFGLRRKTKHSQISAETLDHGLNVRVTTYQESDRESIQLKIPDVRTS